MEAELPRPRIVVDDGNFGFAGARFGFAVTGNLGASVVVEASGDWVDWIPMQTNVVTFPAWVFRDSTSSYQGQRYYRVRQHP